MAADPKGRLDGDARLIIIAHNSHVSFTYSTDSWRGDPPAGQPLLAEAAANLSGLGSNLAAPLLKRLHTQAVPSAEQPSPISVPPLVRWVNAAHSLPVQRKAAALVLADLYLSLGQQLGGFGTDLPATPVGKQLLRLGAEFQNDLEGEHYLNNWRDYAEKVDPTGPAGEIARVAHIEVPCSFEGKRDWREAIIPFGEKLLSDFPAGQWAPFVHYVLARSYAARLLSIYRDGYPDGHTAPISGKEATRMREVASQHYRNFLGARPDAPEANFARQEVWRLLAGLPPTPTGFGCTGE